MFKKYLVACLVALLVYTSVAAESGFAGARGQTGDSVKEKIVRLGTGEKARLTVRLNNRTEVKGYVSQAGPDDFVIVEKNGKDRRVNYSDVTGMKNSSGGTGFPRMLAWTGLAVAGVAVYFFSKIAIT